MPLDLVGKGVDVVSRLDYTTQLSDSPTVCRGSRQVVTALFEPFRILHVWISDRAHIGTTGLHKSVDTFSSKYNGDVISSFRHRF